MIRAAAAPVCLGLGLLVAGPVAAQDFQYLEPGLAACPALPAPNTAAAPRPVKGGAPVPGRIQVSCGFTEGSYTLALSSTDPGATFTPRTFIVNFGRLNGPGAFVTRFRTPGLQTVSVTITSNMGSPPARGQFVSAGAGFQVEAP